MKFWLINIFFVVLPVVCSAQMADSAMYKKTLQRFNPIYGTEEESNNIIAFISANLVVELAPEQVKNIDGVVVCSFWVDTTGNLNNVKVERKLRPWIDYAVMGALTRLPRWGHACMRGKNKVEKRFEVVFSFGSFIKPMDYMGFNGPKVSRQIQEQINEQRTAMQRELATRKNKWDNFTKDNAKLKYDNQGELRKNQTTLPGSTTPITPPSDYTPTIKITSKD